MNRKRKHTTPNIKPLEQLYPDRYGNLDEDQLRFIEMGAMPLVLIENANEQFRQFAMNGTNLELMLSEVVQGRTNMLGAGSIEEYDEKERKHLYKQMSSLEDPAAALRSTYRLLEDFDVDLEVKDGEPWFSVFNRMYDILREKEATSIQNYINENKIVKGRPDMVTVGIIALNLMMNSGGHWGAIIINTKENSVELFDAMIETTQGSAYTADFKHICQEILPNLRFEDGTPLVQMPFNIQVTADIIDPSLSLQSTGGFTSNKPALYKKMTKHRDIFDIPKEDKLDQVVDSQNHFCYMWAIWYIDLRLHYLVLGDVLPKSDITNVIIKDLHTHKSKEDIIAFKLALTHWHANFIPIVVIKKYIYCLINTYKTIQRSFTRFFDRQELDFFNNHFMNIWHNMEGPLSLDFKTYPIEFKITKDEDCFDNSLSGMAH